MKAIETGGLSQSMWAKERWTHLNVIGAVENLGLFMLNDASYHRHRRIESINELDVRDGIKVCLI